jgi:hypothetical protein
MKKMMKNYEAPMAEMFEMQMPTVLMSSPASENPTHGTGDPTETGGSFWS